MAATSDMVLYSLTIRPPTAITQAIVGQLSGTKEQQILAASGCRLTLLGLNAGLGKISPLVTQDLFGIIDLLPRFALREVPRV